MMTDTKQTEALWSAGEYPPMVGPLAVLPAHHQDIVRAYADATCAMRAQAAPAAGNWVNAADVDRLVRELDIALNGEDGAALQASLCDVVSQAKAEAAKLGRPLLAAPSAVAVPSDAAIAMWSDHRFSNGRPVPASYRVSLVRDALEKWGTPPAAPQREVQEPFAWHVCSVNKDGSLSLEHAAAWEEAAHEHINDAITEHDIADAASWVVRPAYHAHQPAPVAQGDAWRDLCWQIADALECTPCTADEVLPKVLTIAEEAARYRWLRRWKGQEHEPPFTVQHEMDGTMWGDDLDAAIDATMAAAKEGASHG